MNFQSVTTILKGKDVRFYTIASFVTGIGCIFSYTLEEGSFCNPDCKIWMSGETMRFCLALLIGFFLEGVALDLISFRGDVGCFIKMMELLDVFGTVWFVVGNLLILASGSPCPVKQPICYSFAVVTIISLYLYFGGPFFFNIFMRLCFPNSDFLLTSPGTIYHADEANNQSVTGIPQYQLSANGTGTTNNELTQEQVIKWTRWLKNRKAYENIDLSKYSNNGQDDESVNFINYDNNSENQHFSTTVVDSQHPPPSLPLHPQHFYKNSTVVPSITEKVVEGNDTISKLNSNSNNDIEQNSRVSFNLNSRNYKNIDSSLYYCPICLDPVLSTIDLNKKIQQQKLMKEKMMQDVREKERRSSDKIINSTSNATNNSYFNNDCIEGHKESLIGILIPHVNNSSNNSDDDIAIATSNGSNNSSTANEHKTSHEHIATSLSTTTTVPSAPADSTTLTPVSAHNNNTDSYSIDIIHSSETDCDIVNIDNCDDDKNAEALLPVCFPCTARHLFHQKCLMQWLQSCAMRRHPPNYNNHILLTPAATTIDGQLTCPCCRERETTTTVG